MKFVKLGDAEAKLSAAIAASQHQRVVITKRGKPVCIIIECQGYQIEDVAAAAEPGFWKMIDERRSGRDPQQRSPSSIPLFRSRTYMRQSAITFGIGRKSAITFSQAPRKPGRAACLERTRPRVSGSPTSLFL